MARITSFTSPVAILSNKRSIFKSDGPTPCIGDITPPRTWYRPRYWRVFSIDIRSPTCSTTQMVVRSRSGLEHIGQRGVSERLLHNSQWRMSRRKRAILSVICSTEAVSIFSRCIARRNAVRRPMPGSFVNSETASCSRRDIVRCAQFVKTQSNPFCHRRCGSQPSHRYSPRLRVWFPRAVRRGRLLRGRENS